MKMSWARGHDPFEILDRCHASVWQTHVSPSDSPRARLSADLKWSYHKGETTARRSQVLKAMMAGDQAHGQAQVQFQGPRVCCLPHILSAKRHTSTSTSAWALPLSTLYRLVTVGAAGSTSICMTIAGIYGSNSIYFPAWYTISAPSECPIPVPHAHASCFMPQCPFPAH